MFLASIVKTKTIDKDVLDSEWTLTSYAWHQADYWKVIQQEYQMYKLHRV